MIQIISQEIIDKTKSEALNSPRKRAMYKFHEPHERMQRMINVLCEGTYIQPHEHSLPPKTEQFIVLEGEVACITFFSDGTPQEIFVLKAGGKNYGVMIIPGTIHTLVCLSQTATVSETIDGVFEPSTHKQFADFAEDEKSAHANEYLLSLIKLINKDNLSHD